MLNRLPDFIDPLIFAERQRQLKGEISLNKLPRFSDMLSEHQGFANIELFFSKNKRLATLLGSIHVVLTLECQRCLNTMDLPLEVAIHLAFVESMEQVDTLSGEYDPFMLEEKKISLNQLIEDELLLALPDFPRHSHACFSDEININTHPAAASNHPFSILAQLKLTGDT